ncbi:MAG: carboxypeptidase-like regulatory domain-containing protein, partial [Candidatus Latescibacterota bacterium]
MIKLQGVLRALTSFCVLFALSAVPSADAASAGKIVGVVSDASTGDPLPNANVQLVGEDMGTVADEEGRFVIINVPAGTYTLRATYIGYTALQIQELRVATGLTSEIEVAMTSSDIQVEEMIIKAERPIIDK